MKGRLSGTNLVRVADHNQRVTLHAIRVNGSLTRVELANITGLTPPSIANITKRLLTEGLIEEAGQLRGARGQPPTKYIVARDACYSIGINIDRDHVTFVVVNFAGETLARCAHEVSFALPADVAELWNRWVHEDFARVDLDPFRLVGIGIAIPDDLGLVDLPGRPDTYAQWNRVSLKDLFAEPLGVPVFVENDAAAAAMGEMQLGRGQQESSFFYLLISLALGGGVVADGNYYRGATGRSGEIGFLTSDVTRGKPQQIQNAVSLSGLKEHLRRSRIDMSAVLGSNEPTRSAAKALDEWLETASEMLVQPMLAVNCLLNPAVVLVGGRLPTLCVERLAERLNDKLATHAASAPAIAKVERAALAEDAPAVGGAILPFSHFLLPRATSLWKSSQPAIVEHAA